MICPGDQSLTTGEARTDLIGVSSQEASVSAENALVGPPPRRAVLML